MRILVVGAGATGGYFGGRLLQAGHDVTFLVRPARAEALAQRGLCIESPLGDFELARPATLLAGAVAETFDLVLLSCKAYDLQSAIEALAPAVGPSTAVLPLLNGLSHLAVLDERFSSPAAVLGGQCVISATLRPDGTIVHLNSLASLTFGARDRRTEAQVQTIAAAFVGAGFEARASTEIMQEMWDKWVVLAAMAGATCLMRAPIGAILAAPAGRAFMLALIDECRAVANADGHEPRPQVIQDIRAFLTAEGSKQTSSMLRDILANGRIEADHIIGDMLARGVFAGLQLPVLETVYCHLKAYEATRGAS